MNDFEPINRLDATEEVFNQLKQAILRGDLRKEDKLPSERELAKLFNVSRGVVREAIRGLKSTGFVEIKQGPLGGAFVRDNSGSLLESGLSALFHSNKLTISEVGQVRQFIEPQIARMATLNLNDEYREQLENALYQEKQTFASTDDYIQKMTAIHLILAEMCGNEILKTMLIALTTLTHQIVKELSPDRVYSLHRTGEHDNIVESVLLGDPERAEKSMLFHSNCFGQAFIETENIVSAQSIRN